MKEEKIPFVLSTFSLVFISIQITYGLNFPIFLLVLGAILYPIIVIWYGVGRESLDLLYLFMFGIGVGSILAYGNPHPIGYNDTYRHLQLAIDSRGTLASGKTISEAFAGLYLLTQQITLVVGIETKTVARFIPPLTYTGTIWIFYTLFADEFLDGRRGKIAATLLFAANWGVFRFMLEYRTLNMSLFIGVLLISLVVKLHRHDSRIVLIIILVIFTLGISQLATFIFIMLTSACYAITRKHYQMKKITYTILIGNLVVIAYLLLMGVFFSVFRGGIILFTELLTSSPSPTSGSVESVQSMPYGERVYLLDWILRGMIAFISASVFVGAIVTKRRDWAFTVISGGLIGGILIISLITSFGLLPPRIMTFFAIPTGIIIGIVLENGDISPNYELNKLVQITIICIISLALILSMVKLPSYIVGETQPIRGDAPVDERERLQVSSGDFAAYNFADRYIEESVTSTTDRFITYYFPREGSGEYFLIDKDKLGCSTIYTSGPVRICVD